MLNFSNLNDVEFEYLCKDVMTAMLGTSLERFASGRDGGVDLTDDADSKNIVVQVKHYTKTSAAGLLASLRKEVPKVKAYHPARYYVCCSKELTPQNKSDIYELFSEYMDSTASIISAVEISDFLDRAENADILHRHFKLWIESANILTDILTNDILIDSDALLFNVEEETRMFVQTTAFDRAISCLESSHVLLIIGNPGVGKSITSKMLVLRYAALGYRVRYTTDGSDLAGLKKALSQSPDAKEIILLDDCFGQAYFTMKETQENELLALIRHVKRNPNKRLLMNSRVTIYQEARDRTPDLVRSLDRRDYKAFILDMDRLSPEEKARIFYNHLYFCEVPESYRDNIKSGQKYRQIVRHPNYNPRIIEFACNPRRFQEVADSQYADFILQCLENPEQVWKNEYERRLGNTDRMLLTTLYSLTNTAIPLPVAKQCYDYRLEQTPGIDPSVNHFDQAVLRLSGSMVKIVDKNGKKRLAMANPSINDFLRAHLNANTLERQALLRTCRSVRQLKRLLDERAYKEELRRRLTDKTILSFVFESEVQKTGFIAYCCARYGILDADYQPYIQAYARNIHYVDIYEKQPVLISSMIRRVFNGGFLTFYGLDGMVRDIPTLSGILEDLELSDLAVLIKKIDFLFQGPDRGQYLQTVKTALDGAIDIFFTDVPAEQYVADVDSIIREYSDEYGFSEYAAIDAVEEEVKSAVLCEAEDVLSDLPPDIFQKDYLDKFYIDVSGSSSLINGYWRDERGYGNSPREHFEGDTEIDYIFNR